MLIIQINSYSPSITDHFLLKKQRIMEMTFLKYVSLGAQTSEILDVFTVL